MGKDSFKFRKEGSDGWELSSSVAMGRQEKGETEESA